MRHLNTTGIIIKKKDAFEHDQYVTIFSPILGKIEAIAKGARKINSPFIGHLETLNICTFQLYKSTHRLTLTQCQMLESFKNVRETLHLTMISFLILEIFHAIAREEHAPEMFQLLTETLKKINGDTKNHLYLESFKLKILQLAGALPEVSGCSQCHKRWTKKDQILSDQEGHIVCVHCKNESAIVDISFNNMKLIHFLTHTPLEKIETLRLTPSEFSSLKKLSDMFLHNYISAELKSEKVVMNLRV